jgi:hypothetical protein
LTSGILVPDRGGIREGCRSHRRGWGRRTGRAGHDWVPPW